MQSNALQEAIKLAAEGESAPHQETINRRRYTGIREALAKVLAEMAGKTDEPGSVSLNYMVESGRTEADPNDVLMTMDEDHVSYLHALLGIQTELGELGDIFKKAIFYGAKLDPVHVSEEIGDLMWYVAILVRNLDLDFEDILLANLQKLRVRFPDKFTVKNASERDLPSERRVLESGQIDRD